MEAYRRILGDEQFVRILEKLDAHVASADSIYRQAGVDPTLRADLFLEALRARTSFFDGRTREGMADKALGLHQSLVQKAGLTPAQVAEFNQSRLGATLRNGQF